MHYCLILENLFIEMKMQLKRKQKAKHSKLKLLGTVPMQQQKTNEIRIQQHCVLLSNFLYPFEVIDFCSSTATNTHTLTETISLSIQHWKWINNRENRNPIDHNQHD